MRKIYSICFVMFLCVQCSLAQYNFDKNWQKVEDLELEGKFASAQKLVERIYQEAEKSQETSQIVKSFLYRAKFSLLLTEDSEVQILQSLRETMNAQAFPANVILENIYARLLTQYLYRHQYQIRNRSSVAFETIPSDIELWDIKTFVMQIHQHFQHSIAREEALLKLPVEDYMLLLEGKETMKMYRSSLFEILAHNALDFYKTDIPYTYKSNEKYQASEKDFAPTATFLQQQFPEQQDEVFAMNNTLRLFQKLEKAALRNKNAHVDIVLQRFAFLKSTTYSRKNSPFYIAALQQLAKTYQGNPLEALINYELANHYLYISEYSQYKFEHIENDTRVKALSLVKKMSANYPNAEGGIKCALLQKKIEEKSIKFTTEAFSISDKPTLAQVKARNVDTLFLKAYRIPHGFLKRIYYRKRDSVIAHFIKRKKAILQQTYVINIPKDYHEHTTEISIPSLATGSYLVVLSDVDKNQKATNVISYNSLQKTNLAEVITEFNDKNVHTIVHRDTGKPIHRAKIAISNLTNTVNQTEYTNIYGQATINKRARKKRIEKYIIYKGDTLYTASTSLEKKYEKDEESYWEAKPFIFTDRAIYRPGQTVQFKVVVLQQKNGVSAVVPNVFCEVEVYSEDGELKFMRLKTNEFGSFSGSFKIPKNSITGDFTINVDQDYEYEGEHPFWDAIDEFHDEEYTFKVEEYKRPRFEVLVNPVTSNVAFNDSINVTGTAKALLGSAVTNAKVSYKISRVINAYGRYNEKSQIVKEAETRTDEKGNFSIPFVALIDETVDADKVYAYQYTVSLEITDSNGETQTAEKIVSVSRKGFDLYVDFPRKTNKKVPLSLKITTEDINDVNVAANGHFKIYKLKNPTRTLKKRPWSIPEYHSMSKETFIAQFPHIQYDKSENNSEKETHVAQETFNTGNKTTFTLDVSKWKSGTYAVETAVYDEKLKDSVTETQHFFLVDANDQYLANNQLFDYEIRNSNYKKDGYILVKLATALRDEPLNVHVQAFYESAQFFADIQVIEKGSKIIKIPLEKRFTNKVTVRMSFVKFNTFYQDEFPVSLYEGKSYLNIETTTFRNKLRPGQPETWQFKILDLENNPSNAEVLASMYDESLDQFVTHDWNTNLPDFRKQYYDTPQLQAQGFKTKHSDEFYNLKAQYYIPKLYKHLQLNWFGLSFRNTKNANDQYLRTIKWQKHNKNTTDYSGNIIGHVLDESGLPLPGANVMLKGTDVGTTTDFDGLYSINASSNQILVFSYVGFNPEEVKVGNQKNISVRLSGSSELEEVTVVAYGISKQKASLGYAVATVDGTSVQYVPVGSLDEMLQGMAAGINIETGSGQPGQSSTIVIRGWSSLKGETTPLFVIDGVPVDQNVFRNLSSQNITTLSVLKDAQATALYGSRGAGGVILITTKYGTRKEMVDGVEVIVGITEEDVDNIETRKNLQETAFFYPHLRTDAEGNVAIEFDAPEALSRWKFQLFAHQKDGIYGNILKNAVTQKELMVVPNMPRFLREKDTIVISTKVVNLQNKVTKGIASLRLIDAQTQASIDAKLHLSEKNKAFTVDAKGNATLSWKLYIPEGIEAIQYKVLATAENFSDGEESVLPVLKNSLLLTEAKPFLVKAGEQKTITFEKLKNNTSSTLQNHQLTLEYTSNPTWSAIQSLPYLMEYPYECAEQTFARLYANAIAAHILQSSPKIKEVFEAWKANGQLVSDLEKNPEFKSLLLAETPWVRDAASETARKQQLTTLFDEKATEEMQKEMWLKLNDLQNESGGFVWFAGGKENHYITLHILQTFAHLVKLNVITATSEKLFFEDIIEDAFSYVDTHFLIAYAKLRDKPNATAYAKQIPYLYTRSMNADFMKIPANVQEAMEVYLDYLQDEWLLLPINQKAMLALTLARMNRKKEANKIMTALEEAAVTSEENGMYWKELSNQGYASARNVETHALLIEAFAEITKNDTIVQELQLWLLQQKQRNQWATTKATTKAIYALLLNPKQFVSIKDNTKFTIGTEKISTKKLDETEKEAGTGYFKTAWRKDEITKDKATINVKNNGKTTGFGAVYWQYFETLDKITKSEASKLQVSKSLYVKETRNGEETLVPIEKKLLKIGDKITVRLTIRNEKEVEFIHLKDMRAAGLEAVATLSEYKWQDGIGYYESTRDASTNFFFDRIPKGVFILEYEVRVNNTGNFSNGITTIESMYAPELRSHTKGIRLTFE